jgi:hypothetical protein
LLIKQIKQIPNIQNQGERSGKKCKKDEPCGDNGSLV